MKYFVSILPLAWIFLFLVLLEFSRIKAILSTKRDLAIFASICWGGYLVFATEVLSLFNAVTRSGIIIIWAILLFVLILILTKLLLRRKYNPWTSIGDLLFKIIHYRILRINYFQVCLFSMIALQVGILGMVAIIYPPTTWDSMTYHMARIMHWQQDRTVAYYSTGILRQVQNQPFAEYTILNLQVLYGSDRFANMVQWFAMIFSLIAVSNIVKCLNGSRLQQAVSMLLAVSIPIGILEATSTQNDFVVAFWLLCFYSMCLTVMDRPGSRLAWIGAGLSLGLALFTKATAYIYAAPMGLFLFIHLLRKIRVRSIPVTAGIVLLAIMVNSGLYVRNLVTFASPIGPTDGYYNQLITPGVVGSNILRNLTIQIPLDDTGTDLLSRVSMDLRGGLRLLHEFTGVNPVDSRTSYTTDIDPFSMKPLITEELAPNPWHLLLIIVTVLIGFLYFPFVHGLRSLFAEDETRSRILGLLVVLCLAFILFCTYLKWQPWQSRLLLPLFVLWCPIIVILLWSENIRFPYLVFCILLIGFFSFNVTFENRNRPVSVAAVYSSQPRLNLYFANQPDLFPIFTDIADKVSEAKCHKIGLVFGDDLYEYPLWLAVKSKDTSAVIQYVHVTNMTFKYQDTGFMPCAIIANAPQGLPNSSQSVLTYHNIWVYLLTR
jgi:hypothetical protein